MTTYKYPTTLSQDEEQLVQKQYGKNARPILLQGKTVEELINANCRKEHESAWRRFAKDLIV